MEESAIFRPIGEATMAEKMSALVNVCNLYDIHGPRREKALECLQDIAAENPDMRLGLAVESAMAMTR